ncbi:MAG: GSCFA domain-containing protein [Paludibacteraceae bacterium]|nr:GSCFA domain-containing protein [Paludibacteraceae bacterium]
MKLYTSVDIAPSPKKIAYNDKILLLGSCFADNIGTKFGEYYFQTTVNPYGTLYNPASIAKAISGIGNGVSDIGIVEHNGLWHSLSHHGSFSRADKEDLVRASEQSRVQLREALQQASIMIITFGTAWVYKYEDKVVANCHKLPANRFVRRRMTADEIVEIWQPILAAMPDKHWIFTVSPIRHVKDGLHENQISKAILLQAMDRLTAKQLDSPIGGLSYFPSYEIMLDELRDYRFYAEDMVHPSAVAVDYIWQRFVDTYMTADTQNEMRTLHQLWRDRHHRFLHPDSPEAQQFAAYIKTRLQQLQPRYPWLESIE